MARALNYCLLCKNQGEQVKAVAKYYLDKAPNQAYSGWIPVCKECAIQIEQIGFKMIYFTAKEKKDIVINNCKHKFYRKNLVANRNDGRDTYKCELCGCEILRFTLKNGRPN